MTESPRADLNKDPKEIASMFDSLASRYDVMDALMTGGLDRVWMTALRKAVAPHPGERILDLAAGTGASSAALAKGGAEVVACDLSEGMIEVGRERHPEIEFVHGNAMDLDFEDGSFDAVTISWGLRNIPDPQLALREMARVVRPRTEQARPKKDSVGFFPDGRPRFGAATKDGEVPGGRQTPEATSAQTDAPASAPEASAPATNSPESAASAHENAPASSPEKDQTEA